MHRKGCQLPVRRHLTKWYVTRLLLDEVNPSHLTTSTTIGSSCGDGLQCASGQCTSRDQQCRTVMGQHLSNSTHSCYDTDCQLTCASPEFGPGTCFRMQQNFLDGTPCNGDGRCKAGVCNGSTTLGQVKSWINKVPSAHPHSFPHQK